MELSEELATTCVLVKHADADLRDIRDQFEALAREEEGLREHAGRWEDIATRRAAREEQGLSGYASTALGRTFGLPRGLKEILFRGAATGAGAYAGGRLGKELGERYGRIPSESIAPLFTQGIEKGELQPTPIQRRMSQLVEPRISAVADRALLREAERMLGPGIHQQLASTGQDWRSIVGAGSPEEARLEQHAEAVRGVQNERLNQLFRDMAEMDPEVVSRALADEPLGRVPRGAEAQEAIRGFLGEDVARHVPGVEPEEAKILRQRILSEFGDDNMPTIRRMLRHALEEGDLPSGAGRWGRAGKWLGAGAGALLSALPFTAYALYAKHKGGEQARAAKSEARRMLALADRKSQRREELLESLEAASEK